MDVPYALTSQQGRRPQPVGYVHAERLIHKLHSRSKADREAIELTRTLVWWFYGDLKVWQRDPDPKRARALRARFTRIFTRTTGHVMLDRLLARLHRQKAELLRVLDRPEVPLHTNGKRHSCLCHQAENFRRHCQ
jgi:hypothetical protein